MPLFIAAKRSCLTFLCGVLLTLSLPAATEQVASPFAGYRLVDMTHAFDEDTIYWPTEAPFSTVSGSGARPRAAGITRPTGWIPPSTVAPTWMRRCTLPRVGGRRTKFPSLRYSLRRW